MLELQNILAEYISNPWIIVLLLGFMPFSEARGAIIYGMYAGLDPFKLFAASVFVNILAIPFIFWFLGKAQIMNLVYRILGKRIEKQIEENKKHFEKYEEIALLIFVAAPVLGTGAWTGTLLASVLKLDKKKSFFVISTGVIVAASLVYFGVEFFGAAFGMITNNN